MDEHPVEGDPAVILGTVAVLVAELLAEPHRYSTTYEVRAHAAQLRANLTALRALERKVGRAPYSDAGEPREAILPRASAALRRARLLRRRFRLRWMVRGRSG